MKLAALLLLIAVSPTAAQSHQSISENEVKQYFAQQNDCEVKDVYVHKLREFSFTAQAQPETIVVASTCMTGTAGPDVHSVLTRDEAGALKELEIEEPDPKYSRVLFGNRNYDLDANPEDRTLVERFGDTSDRDDPLVLIFRWDVRQHKFLLISAKQPPVFKTSYDCAKAQKEVDRAICYVEPLAKLDVDLNATYTALAKTLSPEARKALVAEQRNWLVKRDADCTIYKWWVECLTNMYTARIGELQKKRSARAKP